ncbi:hypothetical protein B0H15DRAFT_787270 [Mycena belliarum]|uniref:PWWP domain-containing protein n=1 Tax=Mycena belliarum TaxID=1033014 RepID=A0AAD6XK41_9AGAR|nr:hypothetical protein B0H15DRAFT_787270 [Mycena belliae]
MRSLSPKSKVSAARVELQDIDLANLTYLWVLLDFNGGVFGLADEEDGIERIWWPAMVCSSIPTKDNTYRVKLFGPLNAKSEDIIDIAAPHHGNILPYCLNSDEIRFTSPSYVISFPDRISHSPKKRQKLDRSDIEARWYAALTESVKRMKEEEVPSMVFLHSVAGIKTRESSPWPSESGSSKKGKGKGKAKMLTDDELSELDSNPRWSPPPPDSSLTIPGELIFAREKRTSKEYWPAKILAYVPPTRPKQPGRYRVQWIDNTITKDNALLDRELFYVYEDEGFGTCVQGEILSTFQEVVNDTDEPDTPARVGRDFSPSPEPRDPPPSGQAFADLEVREQFVHVKPVLQAVLRDAYPPARERHKLYISGGAGRNALTKDAGERGNMDPRDVDWFHRFLLEWCVRSTGKGIKGVDPPDAGAEGAVAAEAETLNTDDGVASAVAAGEDENDIEAAEAHPMDSDVPRIEVEAPNTDDGVASAVAAGEDENDIEAAEAHPMDSDVPRIEAEAPNTDDGVASALSDMVDLVPRPKPPRQIGCDAYEGLSTMEKMDYCLNVLLPELIVQIFLWRTGKRTSVELLDEEEEARLHALGLEEKRRTDWVFDVKRMRAQKERELRNAGDRNTEEVVGGTVSRPRRAAKR